MTDLIPRATLAEIAAGRNRTLSLYAEAHDMIEAANAKLREAGEILKTIAPRSIIAAALTATWREEVLTWLRQQRGPVVLGDLYRAFAGHPKAAGNPNFRAKIRQVLQQGPFRRVARGEWECAA